MVSKQSHKKTTKILGAAIAQPPASQSPEAEPTPHQESTPVADPVTPASAVKSGLAARGSADERMRAVPDGRSHRSTATARVHLAAASAFHALPWPVACTRARSTLQRNLHALQEQHPDLEGSGIGHQVRGGRLTMRLAIRLYVSEKLDAPSTHLPTEIEGIPTDVVPLRLMLAVGIAGGERIVPANDSSNAGTMGLAVYDPSDPNEAQDGIRPLMLTCAHVVSRSGGLDSGPIDMLNATNGKVGSSMPNNVSFVNWIRNSFLDVALIDPVPGLAVRSRVVGPGSQFVAKSFGSVSDADLLPDSVVWMKGERSGFQLGQVVDRTVSATLTDGTVVQNHFLVSGANGGAFAQPGDSGAAVMRGQEVIGLVRAVDDHNNLTLCFPILDVADKLRVAML